MQTLHVSCLVLPCEASVAGVVERYGAAAPGNFLSFPLASMSLLRWLGYLPILLTQLRLKSVQLLAHAASLAAGQCPEPKSVPPYVRIRVGSANLELSFSLCRVPKARQATINPPASPRLPDSPVSQNLTMT